MADHVRDEDKPGYDLDYEAKYNAYLEWLDEQDVKREKTPYSKVIVAINLILIMMISFSIEQLN